jgi:putative restriction endonuclease
MELSTIIRKLSKLRVAQSNGLPAPHKAILLLSVVQSIESGEINENKIFITPELVARFKDNWHLLVHDSKFNPNFSLPFYHLKSEGFWHLKTFPGREILLTASHSIKSFTALKNTVAYASLDDAFFEVLLNQHSRDIIKQTLLDRYLNGQTINEKGYDLFHSVENQILTESPAEYQKEISKSDEEEIFVRGGVFKKVIPKVYNYTCCISGMKIIATRDIQMIDACHIVPFSESHDDTIKNGLSLSPNFHRAFDRFLVTINTDFEVIVSDSFTETGEFPIKQFHKKSIHLPDKTEYHPSLDNINWHFERFLKMNI